MHSRTCCATGTDSDHQVLARGHRCASSEHAAGTTATRVIGTTATTTSYYQILDARDVIRHSPRDIGSTQKANDG
jgi:hypothetical protein